LIEILADQVAVLFEELMPIARQLALDQVQHTEFHRIHSFLLSVGFLHKYMGQVLGGTKVGLTSDLLTRLPLLPIVIHIVLLLAVERDRDDFLRVGVPIVELELDAEVLIDV